MNPVVLLTAAFNAEPVAVRRAEPGYPWYICPRCGEVQQRKAAAKLRCQMTPRCRGFLVVYLVVRCEGCGAPLTGRSRDGRFCKAKCRKEASCLKQP